MNEIKTKVSVDMPSENLIDTLIDMQSRVLKMKSDYIIPNFKVVGCSMAIIILLVLTVVNTYNSYIGYTNALYYAILYVVLTWIFAVVLLCSLMDFSNKNKEVKDLLSTKETSYQHKIDIISEFDSNIKLMNCLHYGTMLDAYLTNTHIVYSYVLNNRIGSDCCTYVSSREYDEKLENNINIDSRIVVVNIKDKPNKICKLNIGAIKIVLPKQEDC